MVNSLSRSSRNNLEFMPEIVADSGCHQWHHMLSESTWDRRGMRRPLVVDTNVRFGYASGLLIDGSNFANKGELSAGGARRFIGASVSGIGLELVRYMRRDGLRFSFVAFDGVYGQQPCFVQKLNGEGEYSLTEVHSDQVIFIDDSASAVLDGCSSKGRVPSRLCTASAPGSAAAWTAAQPAAQWRRLSIRSGEQSELIADCPTRRVWVWDGKSPSAQRWYLLVRRKMDRTTLRFCLSNAKPGAQP